MELLEVLEDHKVILVDQQVDHLEDLQVAVVELVELVILVELAVELTNKMVVQEQILAHNFQAHLTLVYMAVVVVELQELINLKEEKVDQVEAVMEKEDLLKQPDQTELLIQVVVEVEVVDLLLLVEMDLMVDQES